MIDIKRIPDYAEVLVEKAEENDATLRYEVQNDRVNVYLSAPIVPSQNRKAPLESQDR